MQIFYGFNCLVRRARGKRKMSERERTNPIFAFLCKVVLSVRSNTVSNGNAECFCRSRRPLMANGDLIFLNAYLKREIVLFSSTFAVLLAYDVVGVDFAGLIILWDFLVD